VSRRGPGLSSCSDRPSGRWILGHEELEELKPRRGAKIGHEDHQGFATKITKDLPPRSPGFATKITKVVIVVFLAARLLVFLVADLPVFRGLTVLAKIGHEDHQGFATKITKDLPPRSPSL
jgi:hypothetical protein